MILLTLNEARSWTGTKLRFDAETHRMSNFAADPWEHPSGSRQTLSQLRPKPQWPTGRARHGQSPPLLTHGCGFSMIDETGIHNFTWVLANLPATWPFEVTSTCNHLESIVCLETMHLVLFHLTY